MIQHSHVPNKHQAIARTLLALILAGVFVAFAYPAHAAGTTYYVDTGGANSNDGSSGSPLATLQEAVNRASPGDTITVRAGTYTLSEPVTITNKQGSSSAVLTIRGEGMPVFRGASFESIPVFSGLIAIDNSAYVTVTGIRLENSGWFGFEASKSNNIVFDNNQSSVSRASAIYAVDSYTMTVRNNDVSRFCDQKESVLGSTCQEGISIVRTDGFAVSNNLVHDAPQGNGDHAGGGEGIDAKEGSKNGVIAYNQVYNLPQVAIYVDAWDKLTENVDVYGNIVHNTGSGIAVAGEAGGTLRNVKIHDNLVYATGYHGIVVSKQLTQGTTRGRLESIHIYNNTLVRNGFTENKPAWCNTNGGCGSWGYGIWVELNNISDISIHDNIVVNNYSSQIEWNGDPAGAVNVNVNVLYPRTSFSWANEFYGTNAIEADPLFVNASANDFHLQSGSPAIGVGVGGDPLDRDVAGVQRPSSPIDLGAYAYTGPRTPTPTATPSGGNTRSGSWAARLVGGNAYQNLWQGPISVSANTTYRAEVFIKGSGSIDMRVLAGTWGDQLGATTCAASGSGWTQCLFSFDTGSNQQVTFRLTNPGANDALYLDDAYLGQNDGVNVLPNGDFDGGNVNWVVQSPFTIVQP